ncbi:MAG: hypothetical protein RL660_2954 [Bacteroidota bacterium]|jgi:hypothetical protein
MKKIVAILMILFAAANTSFAQDAAQFSFDSTSHDFGDVPQGPDITYNFTFTNTGKAPLVIQMAKGSCDCTKAEFSTTPVQPGEKGTIKAIFETKDKEGKFSKTIYIFSNATDRREPFEIYINGNVLVDKSKQKPAAKPSTKTTANSKKK